MGVSTSEVGYTSAMPRREDHEVHKDMWGHWDKNTHHVKYEGESNENLKSAIKIRSTARLSVS